MEKELKNNDKTRLDNSSNDDSEDQEMNVEANATINDKTAVYNANVNCSGSNIEDSRIEMETNNDCTIHIVEQHNNKAKDESERLEAVTTDEHDALEDDSTDESEGLEKDPTYEIESFEDESEASEDEDDLVDKNRSPQNENTLKGQGLQNDLETEYETLHQSSQSHCANDYEVLKDDIASRKIVEQCQSTGDGETPLGECSVASHVLQNTSTDESTNVDDSNVYHQPCNCITRPVKEENICRDRQYPGIFIRKAIHSKVDRFNNKKKTNRVQINMTCCYICGEGKANFRKHIVKHKDHPEVKLLQNASTFSERKRLMCMMRLKGNHRHNITVLNQKHGEFLISRSSQTFALEELFPCVNCFEWLHTRSMARHQLICPSKQRSECNASIAKDVLLGRIPSNASQNLVRYVFPSMRNDEISCVAKSDKLITALGNRKYKQHADNTLNGKHYTSSNMRRVARLLIEMRNLTGSQKELSEYLKAECYDDLVKAVMRVTLLDDRDMNEADTSSAPSTAIRIGNDLSTLASLKVGMIIRGHLPKMERATTEDLLFMMNNEWCHDVNRAASKAIRDNKRQKPERVPDPDDLLKLNKHLIKSLGNLNLDAVSYKTFTEARKYAATRLLLFNKRRSGELQQAILTDYDQRNRQLNGAEKALLEKNLTSLEKDLLLSMDLMTIRGKVNHDVPVLIPCECAPALKYLANEKVRCDVGIKVDNQYLFANTGDGAISLYDCLKSVCTEVDVEHPENINSVTLRKYMATMAQVLALKDHEVEQLCRHLGHSMKVHKLFYRQMSGYIERVNVGKIMLLQEYNVMEAFSGQSIENITLDAIVQKAAEKQNDSQILNESHGQYQDQDHSDNEKEQQPMLVNSEKEQQPMLVISDKEQQPKKKKRRVMTWSDEAVVAIKQHFKAQLQNKRCPNQKEIVAVQKDVEELKMFEWRDIKYKVRNMYMSKNLRLD